MDVISGVTERAEVEMDFHGPYLMDQKVNKEVVAMDAMQKELDVRKKVSVLQIDSGTRLYFRLQVANKGSEPATDVVIDNPIPVNTVYVAGSAGGGKSQVEFSLDHGDSFARPEELLYEVSGSRNPKELKMAEPEKYSVIRWIIDEILPGRMEELYFQVNVKSCEKVNL